MLYLPHLHRRVDEEIRRSIESRLAQHYAQHQPDLQVTVRSAELVRGKGILVRGLKIRDRGIEGPAGELLHLDEVFLTCGTEIDELLKGEPEVTEVVLRRPTLRVARRADGSWSAARTLRRGWPYVLCWLPAVYFTLLHMVFVSSIRYRQPAMLGLMVLAAGVVGCWRVRDRREEKDEG